MKKFLTTLIPIFILCGFASAQEQRIIYYNGSNPVHTQLIDQIDSVCFQNNISILHNNIGEPDFMFPVVGIDSIVFSSEAVEIDTGEIIYITYNGNNVNIINPWANRGVTVTANGADVTVNAQSGTQDIIYYLAGSTSDGSLIMNSDHRFNLIMHGVSITNPTGAAIKVIDDVKVSVTLENSSTLVDGGDATTHKAAFDSEGQIVFSGNGTLTATGTVKHAIFSNDYIRVLSGNIVVPSAVTDGLHADYFQMYTGSVTISNAATGIDGDRGFIEVAGGSIDIDISAADGKAMKCDSIIYITGGDINLTLTGAYSKGMKSAYAIVIEGGDITINGSGATQVVSGDASHSAGLKCDGPIDIDAITGSTNINITMSNAAQGGKAINADGDVTIHSGTLVLSVAGSGGTYTNASNQSDSYSAACIKTNGSIVVNGGDITLTASGTDSKGFSADVAVTVNDGTLHVTASGADSKGMTADNTLTVNGGDITVTASGNTSKGIKSGIAMLIAGGAFHITASGSTVVTSGDPSYCSGIKADGTLTIDNGDFTINCTNANTGGRCISATGVTTINGGTFALTTAGSGTTYTNSSNTTDGYGPVCLKTDGNLNILGGTFNCESTGTGGRGIKVDGVFTIGAQGADNDLIDIDIHTSGAPISGGGGGWGGWGSSTTYCNPKGIKAMGNLVINSGHVSSYCSQTSGDPTGEAIESKNGIYINGGFVEANSYDDAINAANHLEVNGGYVWAYARGNDGIDCNGAYSYYNGGVVIVAGTEEAIDANTDGMGGTQGHLIINGATIIAYRASSGGGGGPGGMALLDNPTYQNGQKYLAPTITGGSSYCIKNSASTPVMIYSHPASISGSGFMSSTPGLRPPGGGGSSSASFVFTSPSITSGTYTLYTNPTINGTANWHGLYIGASATTSGNGTSVTAQ